MRYVSDKVCTAYLHAVCKKGNLSNEMCLLCITRRLIKTYPHLYQPLLGWFFTRIYILRYVLVGVSNTYRRRMAVFSAKSGRKMQAGLYGYP